MKQGPKKEKKKKKMRRRVTEKVKKGVQAEKTIKTDDNAIAFDAGQAQARAMSKSKPPRSS